MASTERELTGLRAVDLGLWANSLLALLKCVVGVLGRSPALLADGVNSVADVVYYLVVRVLMVLARKPADDDHPYGHERLESIGALVVGCFVIATGVAVLLNAVHKVYELLSGLAEFGGAAQLALWVALFTVGSKLVLSFVTRRIGLATGNPAVLALAQDHRNDVLAAGAAALGIALGRSGYPWVDPAAAAIVALIILYTGVEILRESSADLMGTQPGREMEARIRSWLADVSGVREVQQVHAHSFGPYLALNLTIAVDGAITVAEGDAIADQVEAVLRDHIEFLRAVHVHYHPLGNAPPPTS